MTTAQTAATGDEDSAPPIRTIAGTGGTSSTGDGGPATEAKLNRPYGIAVDATGTLYFAEYGGHRVRKITTDGRVSTVAGTGHAKYGGDGGPATKAQLHTPREVAVDSAGNLYIADSENHRVRKVTPEGTISTVGGTGTAGFTGDGGPATAARMNKPYGLLVDSADVLFVAEWGHDRIRKIATDGTISTIAGTGKPSYGGDGGPAVSAHLRAPYSMAMDSSGALLIADASNHRIRKITPDGTITTIAGTGTAGFSGDDGPATEAKMNRPYGLAMDSTDVLYVTDYNNQRVRKITPDGTITTIAGTGTAGFSGDDGPPTAAQLSGPVGLAVDCVDTLYLTDHVNNRIRRVASTKLAGLPDSGAVVSWANVRSRLRMAVHRQSTKDGAEIHQNLASPRDSQRWRLLASGQDGGEVLYRIENMRSGKVLEVLEARESDGAVVVQRAYEGGEARHQQWRLIPVGAPEDGPQLFEIANGNSGLLLRVDTNARTALRQHAADGDHRERQWQLLPV